MARCCVALGGNLGDVEHTFERARELLLAAGCQIVRQSSVMLTRPVGDDAGQDYKNAALLLLSERDPFDLLSLLQSIENTLGRDQRGGRRPRTIDLDLVFHDNRVLESHRLTLPHPDYHYRRFVLDPLAEIAGDFVDPRLNLSVSALRQRLLRRPLRLKLCGGSAETRRSLVEQLGNVSEGVVIVEEQAKAPAEATFYLWLGAARPNVDAAGRSILRPVGDSDDPAYRRLPAHARLVATGRGLSPASFARDLICAATGQ